MATAIQMFRVTAPVTGSSTTGGQTQRQLPSRRLRGAVHVAAVNWIYWEYAFGPGRLTFPGLDIPPPSAPDVGSWLEDSQELLIDALRTLNDEELDTPRLTNWGEQWPTRQLFKTLVKEQVHHGAEISFAS